MGTREGEWSLGPGSFDPGEGAGEIAGDGGEDGVGFGQLGGADGGDAWLENARFFAGDGGEGFSQPGLVVVAYGGEEAEIGGDDISRVEASAEACLEDDPFEILAGEPSNGQSGGDFEEGRGVLPVGGDAAEAGEAFGNGFGGDHFAVGGNAFAEVDEVWGGEASGAVARGFKEGGQEGADRAFAVGARDMDEAEFFLWRAESLEEAARVFQAQLDSEELRAVEPVQSGSVIHSFGWMAREFPAVEYQGLR